MSEIISQLKTLKLHGMADSYAELLQQGGNASMDMSAWLIQHLLDAETTQRAIRSIGYQMTSARFPVHRTLADFDFSQAKTRW